MQWLAYALVTIFLWGIAYTALIPVSEKMQASSVNMIYGGFMFLISLLITAYHDTFSDFNMLKQKNVTVYMSLYVVLATLANLTFLKGYGQPDVNPAVYSVMTNTYPVIVLVLSKVFLAKGNLDPFFTGFGIFFSFLGCGFLAFAKK